MALRRLLGCLPVAALAVFTGTACKGDANNQKAGAADLEKRCVALGMACGDKVKHDERMIDECKAAAKKQVEKSCTDKAIAAYDCYEKELCGKADKVWTLDDLGVLAARKSKCVAERDAVRDCTDKK